MTKGELLKILFEFENALHEGRTVSPDWLNQAPKECWRLLNCRNKRCPAYGTRGVRCWLVKGTFCHKSRSGRRQTRWEDCRSCVVFKKATPTKDQRIRELLANLAGGWGIGSSLTLPASMEEQLVIGIRAKQRRVIGRWALTPREMEVLSLFMQNPRSRVARMCSLSVETVKMHLKHIYTKLKVHSKRALMQCIRDTLDEK